MDMAARHGSMDGDGKVSAGDVAARRLAQLEAAAGLVQEWLLRVPAHDPPRQHLLLTSSVIGALATSRDHSTAAMTTVRAMVCVNCRGLDASQGKCAGKPLDQCMLLNRGRP